MQKVHPGQALRIRASDYNAFVDAARYVESLRLSRTKGAAPPAAADTVKVLNTESIAIPRFGLVWLVGQEVDGLYAGKRPAHPFLDTLAIAVVPMESDQVGTAWIDGIHPLLCYDVDDLRFPSTAISQSFSYHVRAHSGGNIRLLDWYQGEAAGPLVMAALGRG